MEVIFTILCGIVLFFVVLSLIGRKYRNPYKLTMVFGKKGSGKSTLLTKLALKYHKLGWTVYSTEDTPYSYKILPEQIGYVELDPHSVLLVDEVGMIYDNRNFKSFKPEVRDWFKLMRHRKIKTFLFSQSFDVDKKIRDLTDDMYLVVNYFNIFSYAKRINKKIVLTKSEADRPSSISEDLTFDSLLFCFAGSRRLTYIPKYAKYFNSFEAPNLHVVEFPYNEPPELARSHKWFKRSQKK